MDWDIIKVIVVIIVAVGYCFYKPRFAKTTYERTFEISPYAARAEVRQRVRAMFITLENDGKKKLARARAIAARFSFIELL